MNDKSPDVDRWPGGQAGTTPCSHKQQKTGFMKEDKTTKVPVIIDGQAWEKLRLTAVIKQSAEIYHGESSTAANQIKLLRLTAVNQIKVE